MRKRKLASAEADLLPTIKETLERFHMVDPGDRVLVGLSGGPDSMALLHLIQRLAPDYNLRLGAAHLDHCLRGRAGKRDAQRAGQAAERLGIPFHLGCARVVNVQRKLNLSPEEAARRVRYAFFNKVMCIDGYDKLAVGHHKDDNAEQVLLALIRGTGPRGLSGIAPVRDKRVIRPLIQVDRREIVRYLRKQNITYETDHSNNDPRFLRNRIRTHLLPLLAADYNPRIAAHLNRLADVTRQEEAWMEKHVADPYRQAVRAAPPGEVHLAVDPFRSQPLAVKRRMVRMALKQLSGELRSISFAHVEAAIDLVAEPDKSGGCHLPGGIRVFRFGPLLVFQRRAIRREQLFEPHRVSGATFRPRRIPYPPPPTIIVGALGIQLMFRRHRPEALPAWHAVRRHQAFFDLDALDFPLTLRPIAPGDRFRPLGAGGTQKVKKYLIDHRIPKHTRAVTPVLTDRRRIVWLAGQRMDERAKITAATTRVLGVEFFLLDS